MTSSDALDPPPRPDGSADLTAALRALYDWCGRPKYRTLTRLGGPAASAISGLVGASAASRPPQSTALRFVGACLRHGGLDEDQARREAGHWEAAWQRAEEGTTPAAPVPAGPPARRRWPLVVGGAVLGAALVALVGLLTGGGDAPRRTTAPVTAAPEDPDDPTTVDTRCRPTTIPVAHDVRRSRAWTTAFTCPNTPDAEVHLRPAPGSPVISTLRRQVNWYVCWTRGKANGEGSTVWYYTQGDRNLSHPEDASWGYVPAASLTTLRDPDPGAFRRCPQPDPVR